MPNTASAFVAGGAHPVASARTAVGDGVPEGAVGVAERSGGGAAQRPGVAVDEPRTRACTSRPRAGWAHIVFAAPGHFFDATVVSGGGARRTVIAVDIRSRPLPAEAGLRWGTPGVKSAWAATLAAAAAGGNAAAGGYAAVEYYGEWLDASLTDDDGNPLPADRALNVTLWAHSVNSTSANSNGAYSRARRGLPIRVPNCRFGG